MEKLRLLIVDDILAAREGLVAIANRTQNIMLVKTCEDGAEALIEAEYNYYDVALVDLQLGRDNGILVGRKLIEIAPNLRVIIYSKEASIVVAAEIFRHEYQKSGRERRGTGQMRQVENLASFALTSSLFGYVLLKNITPAYLDRTLTLAFQQPYLIDQEIVDLLLERFRQHALTPREIECSELISRAKSNAEIAQALGISQQAVENLINSLYNKLAIGGEPKDPGRRVMLALKMLRWHGLSEKEDY